MESAIPPTLSIPPRPRVVAIGAALLLACAALLLGAWIIRPESVTSNGGQVFFMLLWMWLAYSAFSGLGWVRVAILIVVAAFVWGLVNAASFTQALMGSSIGDLASKGTAMVALVVLCTPDANRWFSEVAKMHSED